MAKHIRKIIEWNAGRIIILYNLKKKAIFKKIKIKIIYGPGDFSLIL